MTIGGWLRPVSERAGLEISEEERRFADGGQPEILDIVRITFKSPQPVHHQTENHLIDSGTPWVRVGRLAWKDMLPLTEQVPSLWGTGHSSYHGTNDSVPASTAPARATTSALSGECSAPAG